MNLKHTAIIIAITSAFSLNANAESLTFSDGQNHVIDQDVSVTLSNPSAQNRFGIDVNGEGTLVSISGSKIGSTINVAKDDEKANYVGIIAASQDGKNGATLNLGGDKTQSINVNVDVKNSSNAIGLRAFNATQDETKQTNDGGQLVVNSKDLVVNVHTVDGVAYGINAQNGSTVSKAENVATLTINSENTSINVSSDKGTASAIVAMSEGIVKINGNLYAKGDNAIVARGGANVTINESSDKTVQLVGDINFNYNKETSGTSVNADVKVNLSGPDSYWIGNAITSYSSGSTTEENMKVTGLDLGLSDGAQWTPDLFEDSASEKEGMKEIAINQLAFNGGVINVQNGADQVVEIENMTGTGGTVNLTATTDGNTIQSGSVKIGTAKEGTMLAVSAVGITADDVKDAESAMKSLNEKVSAENGVAKTNTISEGDVNGVLSQEVAADGTTSSVQKHENTKLASMKGVNAAALVAWRDEVAYTNQRMEFLRDHEHAYGAWGQVYGGESTYEGKVDLKTTTVQVGADAAVGDWIVGAAFSYMNGDADMHNGNADTDAYTVSLYTSRMFDSGLFVNGLARYGRLSTDATAGNMDADYDNDAFSIGGNVGYRINFTNQAFVEPSFGLQYAYVKGDTYTAGNGVKVEQDDFDALIASLGARAGFNFPNDSGRLFARASVNHDFMGEIDGTASKGTLADSMYVDLGGTWFTYGVGAQFDVTKNLSFWGNIDRTTGGEVSTNYMMNAGLRYVF